MTEETNENKEASRQQDQPESPPQEQAESALPPGPVWESRLDSYPARPEGEQDPRWALNLFWIWACFTVASIIFMATLIILGFWYD